MLSHILVNIGSGYGLVLLKHQSIIWTNLNKWASLSLWFSILTIWTFSYKICNTFVTHKFHLWNSTCISTYACILSLHYTKPCISTNTHKNMSPDDGTVATPHERPPLLRGHFHTTFRVAAGEGFYCILLIVIPVQSVTPLTHVNPLMPTADKTAHRYLTQWSLGDVVMF